MSALTPKQIVKELNKYIVGQKNAKRAVAIALRNRWRRQQVSKDMKDEIVPNNIILIGSTGVVKTEIARRLANLANAPFKIGSKQIYRGRICRQRCGINNQRFDEHIGEYGAA